MGREFELKYAATAQVQAAIAAAYGSGQQLQMETTYFDTKDGSLATRNMTLRLRLENGSCVCTLKTPLPDGSRGEWECDAPTIQEGIASLLAKGAPAVLQTLSAKKLQPVCGARFTRLAIAVPTSDGMAELALDKGILTGGGREIPLCEVEVELKSGSEAATLTLAHQLADTYKLTPQPMSKFHRAKLLAKGEYHG